MTDERAAALIAEPDEESRWDLLTDFVRVDSEAARRAGLDLLSADAAPTREVAADLLGQSVTVAAKGANEVAEALLPRLVDETDPAALAAVVLALGHTHDERARAAITRLGGHEAVAVRDAVAVTLPSFDLDDDARETLRRLSADPDDHVRDWATFALAESDARDGSTIEALAARVDDADDDTRAGDLWPRATAGSARSRLGGAGVATTRSRRLDRACPRGTELLIQASGTDYVAPCQCHRCGHRFWHKRQDLPTGLDALGITFRGRWRRARDRQSGPRAIGPQPGRVPATGL